MNRVISIRNKLHDFGIEKRPDEVYRQLLDDSGGREEVLRQMLEDLDTDHEIFMGFVHYLGGTDIEPTPWDPTDLALGFISCTAAGMLFLHWVM